MSQEPTNSQDIHQTQEIEPEAKLAPDTVLAGRFKVMSSKGQGQYGAVYLAHDLVLQTNVAIKVLHPWLADDQQRLLAFKQEILLLRQLSHPNIVRVHEYYQDEEIHFLTMDWIEGVTLQQTLLDTKLNDQQIQNIVEQLFSALEFAEQNNVIHKDIKPDNILLDKEGKLYLADFGLAVIKGSTEQSRAAGTPIYAAPEFLQKGQVSTAADRYSAGIILYQLVCARLPFKETRLEDLIAEKQLEKFKIKPIRSSLLCYKPIILKLLNAHPANRAESASDVLKQLNQIHQAPRNNAKQRWVAATLLISMFMLLAYWFVGVNKPESNQLSHHSVALLPIETTSNKAQQLWFAQGLIDVVNYQLSQQQRLRIIDSQRVNQTLNLVGIDAPYETNELATIAKLLGVDRLITLAIESNEQQHNLSVYLWHVKGTDLNKEPIYQVLVSHSDIQKPANALSNILIKKLTEKPELIVTLTSNKQLETLISVKQLLRNNQLQDAVQKLQIHLVDEATDAHAWFQLAQLYLRENDVIKARQAFIEVTRHSPDNSLVHQRATAQLKLLDEQFNDAEVVYLNMLKQFQLDTDIRLELANHYINTQQLSKAEEVLKQVIALDTNHPSAWFELAKVAIWSGETQKAIEDYLVRALVVAKSLRDNHTQADILNAMGVAYQRMGDLDNAMDFYQQGLAARSKLNNLYGMATSQSNLAALYAIRGDYQNAEANLLASLELFNQLDNEEGKANTLNDLGILFEEQGQYLTALRYYKDALSIRMRMDDEWLQAESMNNIGFMYYLTADAEHAMVYWLQAERAYQNVQDPVGVLRVKENIGQLELERGNWQKAFQIFTVAFDDAKALSLLEERIVAKVYLAKIGFLHGNFTQSLASLNEVYEQLKERQDIRGTIEFGLWLVEWQILTGGFEQAKQLLYEIEPLVQDKASDEQLLSFNSLQLYYNFKAQQIVYEDFDLLENIPPKIRINALLKHAEIALSTNPQEFEAAVKQVKEFHLSLYRYEQLKLLELQSIYATHTNDWQGLEQHLIKAEQLQTKIGLYWRSFQFQRLRALLAEQQNLDALPFRQRALRAFNKLLEQLPEQQRNTFINLEMSLPIKDQFKELIKNGH